MAKSAICLSLLLPAAIASAQVQGRAVKCGCYCGVWLDPPCGEDACITACGGSRASAGGGSGSGSDPGMAAIQGAAYQIGYSMGQALGEAIFGSPEQNAAAAERQAALERQRAYEKKLREEERARQEAERREKFGAIKTEISGELKGYSAADELGLKLSFEEFRAQMAHKRKGLAAVKGNKELLEWCTKNIPLYSPSGAGVSADNDALTRANQEEWDRKCSAVVPPQAKGEVRRAEANADGKTAARESVPNDGTPRIFGETAVILGKGAPSVKASPGAGMPLAGPSEYGFYGKGGGDAVYDEWVRGEPAVMKWMGSAVESAQDLQAKTRDYLVNKGVDLAKDAAGEAAANALKERIAGSANILERAQTSQEGRDIYTAYFEESITPAVNQAVESMQLAAAGRHEEAQELALQNIEQRIAESKKLEQDVNSYVVDEGFRASREVVEEAVKERAAEIGRIGIEKPCGVAVEPFCHYMNERGLGCSNLVTCP